MVESYIANAITNEVDSAMLLALRSQLAIRFSRKESLWKQLSRANLIKNFDGNTKYFRTMASIRRRQKLMVEIKKGTRLLREPRSLNNEVGRFYKSSYKQHEVPTIKFENGLVNKLSLEKVSNVELLPSVKEIKRALWDCDPSKAPRADGFNLNFVRKCWDTIGGEFSTCIFYFFVSGTLPRRLNMMWVTLALKFEGAQEIKDYKPISIVGCVYRVVAKIMANRLRGVMGALVGES